MLNFPHDCQQTAQIVQDLDALISSVMDIPSSILSQHSIYRECDNDDISVCINLSRLQYLLNEYVTYTTNVSNTDHGNYIFTENTSQILLDDFFHLISKHNDDESFEFIFNKLGVCNVNECAIFHRNYRNRNEIIELKYNTTIMPFLQFYDKIHCYYCHCYDISHKLSSKDKQIINQEIELKCDENDDEFTKHLINRTIIKTQKILSDRIKSINNINTINTLNYLNTRNNLKYNDMTNESNTSNANSDKYHFGFQFKYGYKSEHLTSQSKFNKEHSAFIEISPKYSSLKEELIQNDISFILLKQFQNEYEKANVCFNSFYCKHTFLPTDGYDDKASKDQTEIFIFLIDYILALMIYCNYDKLAYEFSKTYREYNGDKHNNFYWMGMYIKIATQIFGIYQFNYNDKNRKTRSSFYHGIGQKLLFLYGNKSEVARKKVFVHGPLSTSADLEVALRFATNSGFIIEICPQKTECKSFSCQWLSDFPNENEYLFVQCTSTLRIDDIIDTQFGFKYGIIFKAILMLYQRFHDAFAFDEPSRLISLNELKDIDFSMQELLKRMIEHQLSLSLSKYPSFTSATKYAKECFGIYCDRQTEIWLDYTKKQDPNYSSLFPIFWQTHYDWVKLIVIMSLYPNVKDIIIKGVNLSIPLMNYIYIDFSNRKDNCSLQTIIMYTLAKENSDLRTVKAVAEFKQKFDTIGIVLECQQLGKVLELQFCLKSLK